MVFYLTFCSWVFLSSIGRRDTILNNQRLSAFISASFIVLVSALILSKDLYQGDMINYVDELRILQPYSLIDAFQHFNWEPMFVFLQWGISRFTTSANLYVLITWLIYAIVLHKAASKIVTPAQTVFIMFAYLNYSMFYDYIFVGTRQGFAMVFMLLAISYWISGDKPYKVLLAGTVSGLFHYSAIPIIALLVIIQKRTWTINQLLAVWLTCAMLFFTRIHESFLMLFSNYFTFLADYTSAATFKTFGGSANRLDFLLFSAASLLVCLLLHRLIKVESPVIFENLIKCYIAFNCYFLLFGFISFSNRVAAYSWFLIPLLLWFPILNQKRHNPFLVLTATAVTFALGVVTATIKFYQ